MLKDKLFVCMCVYSKSYRERERERERDCGKKISLLMVLEKKTMLGSFSTQSKDLEFLTLARKNAFFKKFAS